ncbi:MAG: hypothetical protein J5789_07235 [Oscillospiraceae bacterium]|nr:hypothetical protein [Oscillospiraceae bacterium]
MNSKIGMTGAAVNALTVLLFAAFMAIGYNFGSFLVCIFLAISFLCMIAAFDAECTRQNAAAGRTALILAGVYAVLIMIVYFTQCTTVANEELSGEAVRLLKYGHMSLMFNLDLLGYGIMALSTFFIGLTLSGRKKRDRVLKCLLLLHGLFFPGCLILPMTGMFLGSDGSASSGGVIALELWCLFFLPIGILSFLHFKEQKDGAKETGGTP